MPVAVFLGIDLSVWLIAIGVVLLIALVVYIVDGIVKIIDKTVGGIPIIGGFFSSAAHTLQNIFVKALAPAASGAQAIAGAAIHALAREVDWIGREIERHANLLALAASLLIGVPSVGLVRLLVNEIRKGVRAVEAEASRAISRIHNLELRLAHGVSTDVLPRIGRLEREYDRIIDRDIAGLRSRTKTVEKSLENVWEYVRSHPWTVVTDAFVGAVAVALTRLDLGWIRCPSMGKLFGKWGCGIGSLLDDLLSIAVSALILENVCAVLPVLEDAFGGVVGPVTHILTEVPLGGCETPPKSWAQLHVAAGPLPPRQTLGALPT